MLKLHVFLVDTGIMFTFDMEMALESVSKLMEAISMATQIPVNKQVLLVTNGEPLNPSSRVGSYKSAGTETNPIFLFSKSAIESPQPPTSSLSVGAEASLDEQVEKCLQMPSTYDTLVVRAKLASEFHLCARELGELCENLVGDQQLQQQGWLAVVSNLDNITKALNAHGLVFKQQYTNFLLTQEHYLDMLDRFDDVISLLSRIPVLTCLLKKNIPADSEPMVLLEWISSKEQKTSIQTLVTQCKDLLNQFDARVPHNLMEEINRVLESSDNSSMKEIRGLDERLVSLQQRLSLAQQFVQDQADMAQGFKQNQMRAEHLGDPSVLPDLCASHQKQLLVLLKNHRQLRDICTLCTKAKDELSANLHARLRWVMYVEHSICNCDSKLLVFHESLKKMKRRLEVFEQVFEAPRMYILAVLEILRRKSFSAQFIEWGRSVSVSSAVARSEELDKRSKFSQVFGSHFLQSLFVGLDDRPSTFAEVPPSVFDERLPEIDVNDIRLLQQKVPELLIELSLGDSLEQSVYVRERLSQKNLSKLVDPKSNPSLEETLKLRERTGINAMPKMTVSQLQKEISQEDIPLEMTQKQMDWQLGDSTAGMTDGDFEPSSLKTLPSGMEGLHSSQSSDISDSMFRSAEGLDEEEPKSQVSASVEVVGVLELSEDALPHSEDALPHSEEFLTSEIVDGGFENIAKSTARPIPQKNSSRNIESISSASPEGYGKVPRSRTVSPFISVASPLFRETVANVMQSARLLRSDFTDLGLFVSSQLKTYEEICKYFNADFSRILSELVCKCSKLDDAQSEAERLKNELDCAKKALECSKLEIDNSREALESRHMEELMSLKIEHRKEIEEVKAVLNEELQRTREETESARNTLTSESVAVKADWESKELNYQQTIENLESDRRNFETDISELKESLNVLKSVNSQLEAEHQQKFNFALKKVKKEKEKSVQDLQNHLDLLKSESLLKDEKIEQLRAEIKHYEGVNSSILSRLETLESDNEAIEDKRKCEVAKTVALKEELETVKNELSGEKIGLIEKLERYKIELSEFKEEVEVERTEKKASFVAEIASIKEKFDLEKTELLESLKTEKLLMSEKFEDEKQELIENQEKEKTSFILSLELEKQRYSEELEKQSLSKTSSIEEGIDALEWEKLLQKLKDLEMVNKQLQAKLDATDSPKEGNGSDATEDTLKTIQEKESEIADLRRELTKLQNQIQRPSPFALDQNISFRQIKVNDLVLMCFDQQSSNYVVLTTDEIRYFLHPDSIDILNLKSDEIIQKRGWFLAYIINQEYCLAKKVHNRFKLLVGTYFYRIQVKLWTP